MRMGKKNISRSEERKFIFRMIAPMLVLFICFGFLPIAYSLLLSVENVKLNVNRPVGFVGFENYIRAFSDEVFLASIPKTIYFCFLLIIGSILLGMCFALIVNSRYIVAKQWFILIGLLPWAIPKVVSGLMFSWIFDGNYGILNYLAQKLGLIEQYQWWFTKGPYVSLSICAIVSIWRLSPFVALMLYAGMQNIPQSLYDAASIDGTSSIQSFWHITIPELQPVLLTSMILVTTWALKTYDSISVMTGGGPGTDTTISYLYIYQQAFSYQNTSYSAALGWLFGLVILLFIVFYVKTIGRNRT